jgi:serine/threonine protein kinase
MIDAFGERDPVEELADEFALRCRRGEYPAISEYAERFPHFAEQIEKLFPTVAWMEQLRVNEEAKLEAVATQATAAHPPQEIGDFRIVREIGRGGMGIVYEAEQKSLARRVALKILPRHVLLLDKHLRRFRREAQTAARLQHTNIVPVYGVGEHEGLHYYAMPLVRGVGLDEILRRLRAKDHLPRVPHWHFVARVGIQAAEALAYAHAHHVLHRDIKPSNLLIDEEEVVCVADFGLARAIDQSKVSHTGDMVGTLRYMAPEQFQDQADARSDIYSLGLTLYELLTLRPAFGDTERAQAVHGQGLMADPTPPSKLVPTIPRDLETVILKCLAPEPENRYPGAGEIAADLRCFLADKPIQARRASALEKGWRWCRRNSALASTSALALLLLIAVVVTTIVSSIQTKRAHKGVGKALNQAEASSQLALDVLDGIYLQLSPDRLHLRSDADLGSDALSCVAHRGGARHAEPGGRRSSQIQASRETAALLQELLIFYDRLAEQTGDNSKVRLRSAIASRRVGDIRQRLGQLARAEREYDRALDKLATLRESAAVDSLARTERARNHNEIGILQSARAEYEEAYQSHQRALSLLTESSASDEIYRYELARTYYFLSSEPLASLNRRRSNAPLETGEAVRTSHYRTHQYRQSAREILEQLCGEHPSVPDYRFLLALCHRLPGIGPAPAKKPAEVRARQQAIGILEELVAQYPQVAEFRYELAATYAWIHTGLYRWERNSAIPPDAEEHLLRALHESQQLVDEYPTIPRFANSHVLILAKLGTVYWRTERLAEAETRFRISLQTQRQILDDFPDLPASNHVLLEFLRLRLAQVLDESNHSPREPARLEATQVLLTECIENLANLVKRPELFDDRLAWNSFPVAYRTLSRVLADLGKTSAAETAARRGESIRRGISNRMQLYWRY